MKTIKSYQKATKPRHIVNGKAFKTSGEAMAYISTAGFELDGIENVLTISIYHVKVRTFTFFRDNLKSQKFTLTLDEIKEKYLAYLKTKELDWIYYYGHQTVVAFVSADDGLKSVIDNAKEDMSALQDALMETRHTLYPN